MLLWQTDVTDHNMFLGLHVKRQKFLSDVNQVPIFLTDFKKGPYIKFPKNTSRASHADT